MSASLGRIQTPSMIAFLLEYADHAIAVNPDDRLEALAKEQAWENPRTGRF
jgi:phosphoserine phosphatase